MPYGQKTYVHGIVSKQGCNMMEFVLKGLGEHEAYVGGRFVHQEVGDDISETSSWSRITQELVGKGEEDI